MKRALLFIGLVAVLANAVPARAQFGVEVQEEKYMQIPHRFQVVVDGASGLPTEPGVFNDYWNTGFQFGIGFGMAVFPWLEVNGNYTTVSFSNNAIESKGKVGYVGVQALEGGAVHTKTYWGSARFIAVPKARTNPYIEVGLGYFSTNADDLVIEGVLVPPNSMEPVNGMCFLPAVGIQYAMNERWTTYAKYTYQVNLNSDFAPGDLLMPAGSTTPTIGGNQVISSIGVGVMLKI